MNKYYILIFCSIILNTAISAQDFAFYKNGQKLNNNAQITISDFTEENDGTLTEPDFNAYFESHLELRNLSSQTINGVMTQEVVTKPLNGMLSFCFGNCVLTNNFYTLETSVSVSNTTAMHLSYIVPKSKFETVKAIYSVYNKLTPANVVNVTVTYNYTDHTALKAINDEKDIRIFKNNQSVGIVNLSGKVIEQIKIYNLTGTQIFVTNGPIHAKNQFLPVTLSSGVYLVKICISGKYSSYKLKI